MFIYLSPILKCINSHFATNKEVRYISVEVTPNYNGKMHPFMTTYELKNLKKKRNPHLN